MAHTVISWTISTYSFRTLRFLIFSHFPSFCPAVAFRLVFPTMAHGYSTDDEHPAFPRATRAHSLGFCCFCFHNLHRVPKKRSRKREKTTLILIHLLPHFFAPYLRLLHKAVKSCPKTDYKTLDYNRLHDFLWRLWKQKVINFCTYAREGTFRSSGFTFQNTL